MLPSRQLAPGARLPHPDRVVLAPRRDESAVGAERQPKEKGTFDDLGKEFDEILGLGQDEIDSDLLGDMGSLLNSGIADLGEEIVET